MACKYFYKGHQFNSELQLDDFLMSKRKYESEFGDLVFQRTEAQLQTEKKLNKLSKQSAELKKQYETYLQNNQVIYDEDGNEAFEQPPYIGVNKFLADYRDSEGNRLFPEFIPDNYWNGRYGHWKEGNYTEYELIEFEFDKSNPPRITDPEQHKKMRAQMENRWKNQAECGTAVHQILQIYFSKDSRGQYNYTKRNLEEIIEQKLSKKNKKRLSRTIIQQGIQYANKLKEDLYNQFGEDLDFYPEFAVSQDSSVLRNGNAIKLFGILDLLVVDKKGVSHILDFKTSIKSYSHFASAKRVTYSYQLATYQRILQKCGVNTYGSRLMIAPIQLINFRKQDNTYIFDEIQAPESFFTIDTDLNSAKMWNNIENFLPEPFNVDITTEHVVEDTEQYMRYWFPHYTSNFKLTKEYIVKVLKEEGKLKPNENGEYTYEKFGTKEPPIVATSESEFVDKVFKYRQSLTAPRLRQTQIIKDTLNRAFKNGFDNVTWPVPTDRSKGGSSSWLKDTIKPYCNGVWEIVDNELLEQYGIIVLKTKSNIPGVPKQLDIIRISPNKLTVNYKDFLTDRKKYKKFKSILGEQNISDAREGAKSGSLILESAYGNMELIETMLILNQLGNLEDVTIGDISVINPRSADCIRVTNEELAYNWKEINRIKPVKIDNFKNGNIKLMRGYQRCYNKLHEVMSAGSSCNWKDDFRYLKAFRSCMTILDQNIDTSVEDKIQALQKLLNELVNNPDYQLAENLKQQLQNRVAKTQEDLSRPQVIVYNEIISAIAHLKGINLRQQLHDHSKWVDTKGGISGTYTDNPGNLSSETLNLITRLTTEAYQNTRDDSLRFKAILDKYINKLKKAKGFNLLQENTIGNQANLYSNMVEQTEDGDFVFKNPSRLVGEEKEFLEFTLETINKRRHPTWSQDEMQKRKDSNDREYYRVPLARGNIDSQVASQGLFKMLKNRLQSLNPRVAFQRSREKLEGIFNATQDYADQRSADVLFSMSNMFDQGEGDNRIDRIKEIGIENLEHNLETLLLKYVFAYSVKDNMDAVFPMIKAATIHLATQGALQNRQFGNDLDYISDYIKNKILNQSMVDPRYKHFFEAAGMLKSAASKLTLAFAPVQLGYQSLQNLWTTVSLMIRQPDGKHSFTFKNFVKAYKIVYTELAHFSDNPTIMQALNWLYGINDMDMNTYTDRISNARKGWNNFESFMFKFAQRPDFYNRMTIFVTQMLQDGCLEAHSIKNGQLSYDWKKDKRFEAFANGRVNDPKYNEQKSLYYAVAQQFVREGAKNEDGTPFVLNISKPMALPRAYTNKEAESMKSLSDRIYGYYSHEKKSLVISTGLGSLWLQFKTFWSSKKNQYLAPGSVKVEGRWVHYSEKITDPQTGETKEVKYYYQVDEHGNILYDKEPTTTPTIAPVMQWQGLWQEGILVTLGDIIRDAWQSRSLSRIVTSTREKWNEPDEILQLAYRQNLKQLSYDLFMWIFSSVFIAALLQDWLDDINKDSRKNTEFSEGLKMAAARVALMSVKNSFMDFNIFTSISEPITGWTPFAFEWFDRTGGNWLKVVTGDEDIWDGVVKTSGALQQVRPVLDAIKPTQFRTEREGGTFGVE